MLLDAVREARCGEETEHCNLKLLAKIVSDSWTDKILGKYLGG